MTISPEDLKRHQDSVLQALDVMGTGATNHFELMLDLEGVLCGVLLYLCNGNCRMAANMMTEGLAPAVERRLAATEAERRKGE